MTNPAAAQAAGLRKPTADDCLKCHAEKGSHRIVLGPAPLRRPAGLAADRPSDTARLATRNALSLPPLPQVDGPSTHRCDGVCPMPSGPAMGYQYSKWRDESARRGLCRTEHPARRTRSPRRPGITTDPTDQPGVPEVPHDGLPPAGGRCVGYILASTKGSVARHAMAPGATIRPSRDEGPGRGNRRRPAEDLGETCLACQRQALTENRSIMTRRSRRSPIPRHRPRSRRTTLQDAAQSGAASGRPRAVCHLRGGLHGGRDRYEHAAQSWPRSQSVDSPGASRSAPTAGARLSATDSTTRCR